MDPRNERLSEFAPPDFYYSGTKRSSEDVPESSSSKQVKETAPSDTSDSERIQRLIAEVRNAPTNEHSSKETSTPSDAERNEREEDSAAVPYTPSDKPITMKVLSKPKKILTTKPAFQS